MNTVTNPHHGVNVDGAPIRRLHPEGSRPTGARCVIVVGRHARSVIRTDACTQLALASWMPACAGMTSDRQAPCVHESAHVIAVIPAESLPPRKRGAGIYPTTSKTIASQAGLTA